MDEEPRPPAAPMGFLVVAAVILSAIVVIFGLGIINTYTEGFVSETPITCVADTVLQADGSCAPRG